MTTETTPIASQAGHWYTQQGEPCYEVEAKNGQMRPTTLRDARKLSLVPSVTTILACAARPGLEAWKARTLLEAALTLPKLPDESLDDYATRVIEDSKEQGRKAAERGTELHAAIERHIQTKVFEVEEWHQPHVIKVMLTLRQYGIDLFEGHAEHSFASTLGFGGKIDWHQDDLILDFKTKANLNAPKLAWPEHCYQLAAYGMGLFDHTARGINVFIGADDCEVRIHEWNNDDIMNGWDCFNCLLSFWKLKHDYNT